MNRVESVSGTGSRSSRNEERVRVRRLEVGGPDVDLVPSRAEVLTGHQRFEHLLLQVWNFREFLYSKSHKKSVVNFVSQLFRDTLHNLFDRFVDFSLQRNLLQFLATSHNKVNFWDGVLLCSLELFVLASIFKVLLLKLDLDILIVDGDKLLHVYFQILEKLYHFFAWTEHKVVRVQLVKCDDTIRSF